ncbi:sensor histidine kinase [Streptomyces sp. NPDC006879]|uniref:sensor histidine kinase n=1 Tax=Streptomyces sp. NPDC006879 TaxID=3364767 RepID=UPI0036CE20F3
MPSTTTTLHLNAIQALCRQVLGFRMAMIALGTPFALDRTRPGGALWLVAAAVLITFMGSYLLIREWERFGHRLLNHPWLLVVDMGVGALLLITGGPAAPLGYVCACTPLLAGLVCGWRGSAVIAALQATVVLGVYATDPRPGPAGLGEIMLLPGLCLITGAAGASLRGLLLRFAAASRALAQASTRLATVEAVEAERARLAREMHDSVSKTLYGLRLAAQALADAAGPADRSTARHAQLVAAAAHQAATEARTLLVDLRDTTVVAVDEQLCAQVDEFSRTTGIRADYRPLGPDAPEPVTGTVARHLLSVIAEALENIRRHAGARQVTVESELADGHLRISVLDDGRGLPCGTTLDALHRDGHFGLMGMAERCAEIGARMWIGTGRTATGTEIRLDCPVRGEAASHAG